MAPRALHDITVHMIGNAHIDPVWLWRADEGFEEVRRTCRSALERMEETPGFIFCRSSAAVYQWLEEHAPDLFAAIREQVAEGRWCIVGGWWVQPDCNLPCGESFIRQALYGKRYFHDTFGVDVRVGYNVDSFGHAATLPQILKGCGLDSYIFFRPGPHEKELPAGLFRWQAPDGTEVLACRPPHHYNTGPDEIAQRIREAAEQAPLGLDHVMCFYGVGDHGGGPTKANIASIRQAADDPEAPNAVFSTPQRFFDAVRDAAANAPEVADELQHHARGCYSVLAAIKRANRECENLLLTAERFAAMADAGFGVDAPQADLTRAWQTVLFHQFHDILAGTSIPEAYEDAWPQFDQVRQTAMAVIAGSLEAIAPNIDTVGTGEPLAIYNSLGFERTEIIEVPLENTEAESADKLILLDSRMEEVPCQIEEGHLVFRAAVPALGYEVYHVCPHLAEEGYQSQLPELALSVSPTALENEFFRLDIADGKVAALHDKRTGADLLAGPLDLLVLADESDTWAHGVSAFRDEAGRFEPVGEPQVVESGPARAGVTLPSRWGDSEAELTVYLYNGVPRIDLCLYLDWHERHKMLKLAVPTALEEPAATFGVPYGAIPRPATGEEEPMQGWLDLTGTADGLDAGLAAASDGANGADVQDGEMRLSLLRSPIYAFHDPDTPEPGTDYRYTDQGEHFLRFRLLPHAGAWQDAAVVREAEGLNVPVYFRWEMVQDGMLVARASFLTVEPETVVLGAFKRAEDGEGLIARLVETAGRQTQARLTVHATECVWEGALRPFEIKTLRLDMEGSQVAETNMLEERA
jgi:alpha-mannosidase